MYFFANRKDGRFEVKYAYPYHKFPWTKLQLSSCENHKKSKKASYYTEFGAFDIETTTYITQNGLSRGFMYIWMITIEEITCYGNTWKEFIIFLKSIVNVYHCNTVQRFVIYVHNLAFEFQFMRQYLKQLGEFEVFAMKSRRPLTVRLECGIEFRCSYYLSNMSLAKATNTELGCTYIKAEGDLDYKKFRSPSTQMTDMEYGYCFNDTLSLWSYIKAKLKNEGDTLATIPLTSTGYVRRECRKACKADPNYMRVFFRCSLTEDVYLLLLSAGRGGDTSSNYRFSGQEFVNVDSYDAQSSYPYQLCTQKYPVTRFYLYDQNPEVEDLEKLIEEDNACLFQVVFKNLRAKVDTVDLYLSYSKAEFSSSHQCKICNGRVLSAGMICFTITDIDWKIINKNYRYDEVWICNLYYASYGYLPETLRKVIIEYFIEKSKLKYEKEHSNQEFDEEKEYLYGKSKNRVNGIFGMAYTNPVRDMVLYTDEEDIEANDSEEKEIWSIEKENIKEALKKFQKHGNSFLVYAWGVWTTARGREHLQWLIDLTGEGTIYWDTDSSKAMVNAKVEKRIEAANQKIIALDKEMGAYCEVNGETYYMGVFEKETASGAYQSFKTLGAKKYAYVDHKGKLHCTISGVAKSNNPLYPDGARELGDISNFKIGFQFKEAGGIELAYHDTPIETHELPNGDTVEYGSGIAANDSTYTIGLSKEYAEFLGLNIHEK